MLVSFGVEMNLSQSTTPEESVGGETAYSLLFKNIFRAAINLFKGKLYWEIMLPNTTYFTACSIVHIEECWLKTAEPAKTPIPSWSLTPDRFYLKHKEERQEQRSRCPCWTISWSASFPKDFVYKMAICLSSLWFFHMLANSNHIRQDRYSRDDFWKEAEGADRSQSSSATPPSCYRVPPTCPAHPPWHGGAQAAAVTWVGSLQEHEESTVLPAAKCVPTPPLK